MNIKEIKVKVRCDMPNCRQNAWLKIEKEGFFRGAGLFLCKECVMEMYKALGKKLTPKSPNNMLNKKIKLKKEEYGEKENG